MKFVVIFAVLCAIGFAANVAEINSKQNLWVAEENKFSGMSIEELRRYVSVHKPEPLKNIPVVSYESLREFINAPDNFDSRTQWPNCKGPILDQGACGSCWAFGAVEAFQDRICIAKKSTSVEQLSTQSLVDCEKNSFGCSGGWPDRAFEYMQNPGIPTEACYPYHARDQTCKDKCEDGSAMQRRKVTRVRKYSKIDDVKTDIQTNGPIETWFAVYDDFFNYKSGIYSPTSPFLVGYHAVEVLGWGVEGGVKFWIAANSWNTGWGDKGYFKIKAGTCQFDDLDKFVGGDAA
jgi:cathepsin B